MDTLYIHTVHYKYTHKHTLIHLHTYLLTYMLICDRNTNLYISKLHQEQNMNWNVSIFHNLSNSSSFKIKLYEI